MSSCLFLKTVLAKWLCRPCPDEQGIARKGLARKIVSFFHKVLSGLSWGFLPWEGSWALFDVQESRCFILALQQQKHFFWIICHIFFFPSSMQSLLSRAAFTSSETKVPPKGFRHLRFTPGADLEDSAQAPHVNINPFTPESYRQMFFLSNGKRKTRGEL